MIDNVLCHNSFLFTHRNITMDENGYAMFHAHQGLEFLYVEQGDGHIIMDNKLIPLSSRTLYCFQPYQLHRIHANVRSNEPYIRTIMVIEPLVFQPYLAVFPELHTLFLRLWKDVLPVQSFEVSEIEQEFAFLQHDLYENVTKNQIEAVALTFITILRKLRVIMEKNIQDRAKGTSRKIALVEEAMAWLDKNYRESFRLGDLAADLHISSYYLSHLFKRNTGSTLSDYVTVKRLREACLLLQNTDYSMEFIALQVGMTTSSHFIYTFKKHMGITPYQFRLQVLES
nr:AraC family transcriptional regulator [Paenibacillus qinlingensis]